MADADQNELQDNEGLESDLRKIALTEDLDNPVSIIERIYQIWWHWADFHLYVITPYIAPVSPPTFILPESVNNSDELEFVYPILDAGSSLSTSKAKEMFSAGMSMFKLYNTIEKMISILIDRLKAEGVTPETEVQVAFGGHQLAQRKAFESIISLSYNVVVTNFDPGSWGENYLRNVKVLADKGYGYPPEAPRDRYKLSYNPSGGPKK